MEKGFDLGENRISLFFVESPDFFSWVSRFSFARGWQVCYFGLPYAYNLKVSVSTEIGLRSNI